MKFFRQLYINNFFFYLLLGTIVMLIFAYVFPVLLNVSIVLLLIILVFFIFDIIILFAVKTGIEASRILPERFSNGDDNLVKIKLSNFYLFAVGIKIIDEIPFQFQIRDFEIRKTIKPSSNEVFQYYLRPVARGEYQFGSIKIYVSSPLGLISKQYEFESDVVIPTFPSFMQLQKFDLMAFSNHLTQYGVKKIRKLGHTMEFEQIKEYTQGDDIRTLNWKATSKKNQLMVNQFQDERSQSVYLMIDKGRTMQMPFDGLSLLDYAINASLVVANVVLKKQDKAGVFSFSKKVDNRVVAEKRSAQMQNILQNLYNVKTDFFESDFSRLFVDIKTNIRQRSLLILFTNFETIENLNMQLSYLKAIARNHLLVVVFFDNTELNILIDNKVKNTQEIYDKVIAEKFAFEKRLIVSELKKHGIYSVLTQPENLTIDTINKYLEIKSRGIL